MNDYQLSRRRVSSGCSTKLKVTELIPMNLPKPLFTNLKLIIFVLLLTAFVLTIKFISIKTPHFAETAIQSSDSHNVAKPASNNTNLIATQSSNSPDVKVWVNTKSAVYHCPNTQWYGNTKHGMFMTQREAQSKGYRPARGAVCG